MKILTSPKTRFWFGLSLLSIFYITIVFLKAKNVFAGDEGGYVKIATNLSKGNLPNVNWWGPGYPLILIPFIKFDIPLLYAKLLNAIFLVGTIIYIRYSLLLYLTDKYATNIALIMGIYPPFLFHIHMTITEKFALLLMSAIVYHYLAFHKGDSLKILHFVISSILLAWLALTKVFYGYVILFVLIIVLLFQLFFKVKLWKTFFIFLLSLIICLPYLWHNYKLTGKIFYWATSGGLSLYWMSTPYIGETGSWFGKREMEILKLPVNENHYKLYHSLSNLSSVEQDDAYKRAAINNIRNHPFKFIFNIANNILRMLFDFPHDLEQQTWKASWVVIPNMFLLTLFLLSFYPAWKARQKIPLSIWSILFFGATAFMGSAILSAYNRMFSIIVPIIVVWTSYVWVKLVKIEIQSCFDEEESQAENKA